MPDEAIDLEFATAVWAEVSVIGVVRDHHDRHGVEQGICQSVAFEAATRALDLRPDLLTTCATTDERRRFHGQSFRGRRNRIAVPARGSGVVGWREVIGVRAAIGGRVFVLICKHDDLNVVLKRSSKS